MPTHHYVPAGVSPACVCVCVYGVEETHSPLVPSFPFCTTFTTAAETAETGEGLQLHCLAINRFSSGAFNFGTKKGLVPCTAGSLWNGTEITVPPPLPPSSPSLSTPTSGDRWCGYLCAVFTRGWGRILRGSPPLLEALCCLHFVVYFITTSNYHSPARQQHCDVIWHHFLCL